MTIGKLLNLKMSDSTELLTAILPSIFTSVKSFQFVVQFSSEVQA